MSAPEKIWVVPDFAEKLAALPGSPYDHMIFTSYTRTDLIPSDPRVEALVKSAEAVVARWKQPTWKDAGPTGQFIGELETAVAAFKETTND